MKANELRIGNWVELLSDDGNELIQCNGNTIKIAERDNDAVYPIVLTNQWLLKFSFEFSGYEEIRHENFILEKFHDGYYYTGGEGVCFGIPITTVHQLQNLYYALTGEELRIAE